MPGIRVSSRNFFSLRTPKSYDSETRSVEVVAATEAPVKIYDWWNDMEKDEYVLMSGLKKPGNGQAPLCDSHDRYSVKSVLGSFKDMKAEDGKLIGRVYFSNTKEANEALTKVREGHLTDFSVGFQVLERKTVSEGNTLTVNGKAFTGPCDVITKWELFELSICPVGADPGAKVRNNGGTKRMSVFERIRGALRSMGLTAKEEDVLTLINRAKKAEDEPKDEKWEEPEDEEKSKDEEETPAKCNCSGKKKKAKKEEPEEEKDEPEDEAKKKGKKAKKSEDDDEEKSEDDEEKSEDDEDEDDEDEDDEDEDAPRKKKGKKEEPDDEGKKRMRAERSRVTHILTAGRALGISEAVLTEMISAGTSRARADSKMLELLSRKRNGNSSGYGSIMITSDERDVSRTLVSEALQLRMGIPVKAPADESLRLSHQPLYFVAERYLAQCGERIGANASRSHIVERALSTTDLPFLLKENFLRIVLENYKAVNENYKLWTSEAEVPDFKEQYFVVSDMDNNIDLIPEGGEYERARVSEAKDSVKILTYGKTFALTRQAIINDDLGQVTAKAADLGLGIGRKVGNLVYGTLTGNPVVRDGKQLFDTAHKNVVTIADTTPTVDLLAKAIIAMGSHENMAGDPLNIAPEYLIAPLGLQAKLQTFFASEMVGTQALPTTRNVYQGWFEGKRFHDLRLDRVNPAEWYLVGPKEHGIKVFYLSGQKEPFFESETKFDRDLIEYKVRFDVAVKAMDYQNFIKVTVG